MLEEYEKVREEKSKPKKYYIRKASVFQTLKENNIQYEQTDQECWYITHLMLENSQEKVLPNGKILKKSTELL